MYEVPDLYPTEAYQKLKQKQQQEKYYPSASLKDLVSECGFLLFFTFMASLVAIVVFVGGAAIMQASAATALLVTGIVAMGGLGCFSYASYVREIAPYRTSKALKAARRKTPQVSAEAYHALMELKNLIETLPEKQRQDFAPVWYKAVAAAEWLTAVPANEQAKHLLSTRIAALEKIVEKHELLLATEKALEEQDREFFAQDYYGSLNDDDLLITETHVAAMEAYHSKLKTLTPKSLA